MKKRIKELLDKKLTEIFIELQNENGITSGDTSPEQEFRLSIAKEKLIDSINEIIEFEISLKTTA